MIQRMFSPSQYHESLMARTPREFAWTGQDFAPWQEGLRARLRQLVGWMPRARCPLNVEELEREEAEQYVRTKLVFTAEEGADVPAHLLVPKDAEPPLPAMVCLQGHSPGMYISIGQAHSDEDRESIAGDRDFAL